MLTLCWQCICNMHGFTHAWVLYNSNFALDTHLFILFNYMIYKIYKHRSSYTALFADLRC